MRGMKLLFGLIVLALAVLTGCSSDNDSKSTTGSYSGVAVDPYIEGAVFQEVAADGDAVLQRESTPSDGKGLFIFPKPLTVGSIVEMKISRKGMHEGAPFEGMLRRKVSSADDRAMVVSPLTTLLANGIEEEDVIDILNSAGLSLDLEDLYRDPMLELENQSGQIHDLQLRPLHANMAINHFMITIDDFDIDRNDLFGISNFQLLTALLDANQDLFNADEIARITTELGGSIHATEPLLPSDLLPSVVQAMRTIVEKAKHEYANGNLDPKSIGDDVDDVRQNIKDDILADYMDRVGNQTPPPEVDGAEVFAANCAGCHNLGSGGNMDLSGKGTAVIEKVTAQHKGRVLDAAQLQALVAHVNAATAPPTPDPEPVPDGQSLYEAHCASCHKLAEYDQTGSAPDLAGSESMIPGKINAGHRGISFSTAETTAVADWIAVNPANPTPDPDPIPNPDPVPDGVALYESECQGCHALLADNNIKDRTADGIQQAIDGNLGGMNMLTLTSEEVQAIADSLPATTPVPEPDPTPADGQVLYDSNCAGCHLLGEYDLDGTAPDLGGSGNQVINKLEVGHMGISLNADQIAALASWANANPASVPTPDPTPVDGQAFYDSECAGCHALGDYDASGSPDLGGLGNEVITKIEAGHMGKTLTADELDALADWADANTASVPTPDPTPVDGQALYDNNCSGCHSVNEYDATGAPDLASVGSLVTAKLAAGHMGFVLTEDEEVALTEFLDLYPVASTGPDYSDCTACHAQPPNGNTFPNTAGAHAVHTALAGVGNDCVVCHSGAGHDDLLDVVFVSAYDAKTGTATANADGTCSTVSCHGGKTTPDWFDGSLSVNTQCASCHSSGTGQYNGYFSGEHGEHRRYDCTVCHNPSKLGNGHFINLFTSGFEQSPASTIGGDSTRVGSYSNGNCSSIECHGSESWR